MDGFNLGHKRDDFSFKNNVAAVFMEIKKLFKDNSLKVNVDGHECKVLGRLGMYHAIIDVTGIRGISLNSEVSIDISPINVNEKIRREYI